MGHWAKYIVACASGILASGNPNWSADWTQASVIVIAWGTASPTCVRTLITNKQHKIIVFNN